MSSLTIYTASAGSGKTFRLAVEYITLLIKNPENYRHILAVTFTNKATEEMKMRIITQLSGISKAKSSSQPYLDEIKKKLTKMSEEEIRERAKHALHILLHDYTYFRVETIDSFFQSVLRNLARELDLTPNLRVDLNDEGVKNEAVDKMISESANDSKTTQVLMKFIHDSINDNKGWNVIEQIKDFGWTIFQDFYKHNAKAINESIVFIDDYVKFLNEIISEFEKKMTSVAHHHFDTQIKSNRNIDGYFNKLLKKEYSTSKLVNQTVSNNPEIFGDIEAYRLKHLPEYYAARLVKRYLYRLALLNTIEQEVHHLNNEAGRFLLSDTQSILYQLIHEQANSSTNSLQNANATFIYEKIGARLRHIMIDEFQDTSVTQWNNFRVLLDECVSHSDSSSLIVGDVKQSIYRWRSGNWRLLHTLPSTYSKDIMQKVEMNKNFRSYQNIVEFNNKFFSTLIGTILPAMVDDQCSAIIQGAYEGVQQEAVNQNKLGYARIEFLNPDEKYFETQATNIYDEICKLKALGVHEQEMAILLRGNKDITKFANYFASTYPDVRIISDEAFLLSSSRAINTLTEAMTYLLQRDDITLANLTKLCDQQSTLSTFLSSVEDLAKMPLYELGQNLLSLFHLNELDGETAYICTFFDNLLNFVSNTPASLRIFIREELPNILKKSIQSDTVDGVRILTIHKSKGLEYDYLFLPMFDWKIENPTNEEILWVQTKGKGGFEMLPIVPVKYCEELKESVFSDAFYEEQQQKIVDNLNLMYVAFTRAKKHLYVYSRNNKHKNRISEYLCNTINVLNSGEAEVFEYGSPLLETDSQLTTNNEPLSIINYKSASINSHSAIDSPLSFRQSNKANYLFSDMEDVQENRERGILLHNILAEIRTSANAKSIIEKYDNDGQFSEEFLTKQEAEQYIDKCINNEKLHDWFSEYWKVINERELISAEGKHFRCDRVVYDDNQTVVIDFKFGKHSDNYVWQVRGYINLLRKIGFNNVSGYLWYANEDKLEEVK